MRQSVEFVTCTPNAEHHIAFTARVSNPGNQHNEATEPKLLAYLIRAGHWSPFEQSSMTLEIVTSRGIAAQILRHRSFCFQEFSMRYAEAAERIVYPARRQDTKNRQNSIDDLGDYEKKWFEDAQQIIWENCYNEYKKALKMGIAKEQARFLLPLGTATKLYMTNNVRGWIHYLQARTADGVQLEHKEIALMAREIFIEKFPNIGKALGWTVDE